jgi:hypothetical protein
MPVRRIPYYRVSVGNRARWFEDEQDARDYARDRFDNDFDGVPFLEKFNDKDLLARVNELEAKDGKV